MQNIQRVQCNKHIQEVPDQFPLRLEQLGLHRRIHLLNLLNLLILLLQLVRSQRLDGSQRVDHTGNQTQQPESGRPCSNSWKFLLVNQAHHLEPYNRIERQVPGVGQIPDDSSGPQRAVQELVVVGLRGSLEMVQWLQEPQTLTDKRDMSLKVPEQVDYFSWVSFTRQVIRQETRQVGDKSKGLFSLGSGVQELDELCKRWMVDESICDHYEDLII